MAAESQGVSEESISLTGRHPYGLDSLVNVPVRILPALPGGARHWHRYRQASVAQLPATEGGYLYDAIGGPYRIEGESLPARNDRQSMISLIWDLQGYPIHPRGAKRPRAKWCAVRAKDGLIEIWRSTEETRHSLDDEAALRAGSAYRVESAG